MNVPSSLNSQLSSWKDNPPYGGVSNTNQNKQQAKLTYKGSCHCGKVKFEAHANPVDAKLCHCKDCQTLHGAPMQWAAIFHKTNIRFTSGHDHLIFYDSVTKIFGVAENGDERTLPCKVSCKHCRSPIADEGRRMWLSFPSLFHFHNNIVPKEFQPTCHIFYGAAVIPCYYNLPKYLGHKGKSPTVG